MKFKFLTETESLGSTLKVLNLRGTRNQRPVVDMTWLAKSMKSDQICATRKPLSFFKDLNIFKHLAFDFLISPYVKYSESESNLFKNVCGLSSKGPNGRKMISYPQNLEYLAKSKQIEGKVIYDSCLPVRLPSMGGTRRISGPHDIKAAGLCPLRLLDF